MEINREMIKDSIESVYTVFREEEYDTKLLRQHNPHRKEMLWLIAYLIHIFKYKKLPEYLSKEVRTLYSKCTPKFLNDKPKLYSDYGNLICNGFNRIVIGDYGLYIEFTKEQAGEFITATGQEYRDTEKYKYCKYSWLQSSIEDNTMIYLQKNTVDYADYKPGMYYVSVYDVVLKEMEIYE